MQCTENGFQTLEVLREGLWASFTGGWFYDLRQNVFCNTFHMYLWLFLLCFPFIIHLYFPPTILVSIFYCSTIGLVFIFLKLINHRLHRMFDTSECIQESIPGEDLPESQKKRAQIGGTKKILEDEWLELSGKVVPDLPSHSTLVECTDDESINSSETLGRPISSTIDLKVDVHHKNSSESSEDLSLKPVIEAEAAAADESEQCGLLTEVKTSELAGANFRSKNNHSNNNKHRLKNDEGITSIQDADLILSLSDCHIAKLRTDSMDDLSDEYKMSQSECHISKIFHSSDKDNAMGENCARMHSGIKKYHSKNKDYTKKKYRKGFSRHLGADTQTEKNSIASENSECLEIKNLASTGSGGLLTLSQNTKEQIKNTGSLELPLKDTDNSNLEKGLLYWKQQNLDNNRVDNLREVEHIFLRPHNELHVCSETNIRSADRSDGDNSIKRLNKNIDLHDGGNKTRKEDNDSTRSNFPNLDVSLSEQHSEPFLFDMSDKENCAKSDANDTTSKSEVDVSGEKFEELPTKSEIKSQVDSDDDSSDNCGLRSPLLCRHESLEKENQERKTAFTYNDNKSGKKMIPRTFSSDASDRDFDRGTDSGFNKMIRTLSVDEDAVLSRRYKTSEVLPKVDRGAFGSVLLSVYDDNDIKVSQADEKRGDQKKDGEAGKDGMSGVSTVNRRSSYPSRKPSLTSSSVVVDEVKSQDDSKNSHKKDEKVTNKDILSWSNERVGLEWLFEHTDSETDMQNASNWKYILSDDSDTANLENMLDGSKNVVASTSLKRSHHSQGAIPKTKSKLNSIERARPRHHGSKANKVKRHKSKDKPDSPEYMGTIVLGGDWNYYQQRSEWDSDIMDWAIVEEDGTIVQDCFGRRRNVENKDGEESLTRRDNFDSSNNSNFELSSLLPLSSLLSSLNPPSSPLLAAFLATRKDLPGATHHPGIESLPFADKDPKNCNDEAVLFYPCLPRFRHKRAIKGNRSKGSSTSSAPSGAVASLPRSNPLTHTATSHDDTSEGAVHRFQDERGYWISYTFYNPNNPQSYLHSSIPASSTQFDTVNGSSSSIRNDGNVSKHESTSQMQSILVHSHTHNCPQRDRDVKFHQLPLSFANSHQRDDNHRWQWHEAELRKRNRAPSRVYQNVPSRCKHQKCGDACDLVSNTSFENDSSLSLNSGKRSPSLEGRFYKSGSAYKRDRLLLHHGCLPNNSNINASSSNSNSGNINSNNNNNADVGSSPIVLSLNEFRNSDNNNNTGRNSNFYLEGPYHLLTETVLERNRQRNILHSPNGVPDFRLLLNGMQDGNECEPKRSHFRLFDLGLESSGELKKKQRHYYKLYYTPLNYIKIRFDRLELIALLDRNLTVFEVLLSLLLSFAVSVCGITLLNYGFYQDLVALLFCFTMAGCHYSLLKSVQPDATSPTHGYNRVVIYSRSIYFCLASVMIILLTAMLDKKESQPFNFYNLELTDNQLFTILRDGLLHILLLFPILFTLGVFPQINTFSLYLLEQIDIHVLGGNAMSNLIGAVYCVLRSVITVFLIYGFAYGALSEAKTSQHILFSIFCGLLIALSYHLSRSSSNPNIVWDIVKNHLFQDEMLHINYAKNRDARSGKKSEMNKCADESTKSDKSNKNDMDDKSDDKNSQNNLLLNSNPSSNETLKTIDTQVKSNYSENFDNSGNASEIYTIKKEVEKEFIDPLPGKLKDTVNARLKNDALVCCFIAVMIFGLHSSTVFTALQPDLNPILWGIAGCSGIVLHYIVPQLRKQLPWLCLARPVLRSHEHSQFEVKDTAKVMWFEETYLILCFLERNLLYPVLVLATLTYDGPRICESLGIPLGAFVTTICGFKMMRSAFSNTSQQYLIVIFTALLFEFDYQYFRKTFLIDYFFMAIVFSKTYEFLLKMQFVVTYIAPWQITWGSTFHAFAQLFSVPHSALLLFQTALSALLSAPLNPFLGSALFFASYVRPVKFWERDYNTKRVDHSNTRLSSHLERNLGSDDNNLNSIFYEHLTRSLQHNLCGDLELGRWGPAYQGDCFILASDYLNCLVHIIEMGNGLVTFQMRGLEFRGTFCQQREVEAISEGVEENDGCCCCQPGHLPNILSVNAAFSQRWLAWEVTSTKYVLEGYSISDNSAKSMLQAFDFRKILVTYYVKSIIFYCIRSAKLHDWLNNPAILSALDSISDRSFVDLDPVFNVNIDQDFDIRAEGITRGSFCNVYLEWIQYCASKREKLVDKSKESSLISLCLALSLMGRRTLGTASHNTVSSVEFFLYGLHALFKGDFRVTSIRDEWIFSDMELLKNVVAPGVRMSLKLHQDHFMSPEEYENPEALYEAISSHEENLVISHEGDPTWREAVLSGTPSLLALRHMLDDGADEYKIIMLNKRYLTFRVIKLNRECVRGLWAGQQQELVFFRNRNPERGSIQNAKQVLRNIINSSCDQPIGYPIYVSPLTTSYSDTNKQYTDIIGGPLSLQGLKNTALKFWQRIRQRCREGCSSGSAGNMDEGGFSFGHDGIHSSANINVSCGYGHNTSGSQSMDSSQMQLGGSNRGGSLGRSSLGGRGSLPSVGKPSSATLASLAGLLSSAEISKGESFLREREASFTLIKERALKEEKETTKKYEELKKLDDLKVKFEDREKRKEEHEMKKEKDKKHDSPEDAKEKEHVYHRVKIIDPNQVFDAINLGRRIDVLWPDEGMRARGGRSHWKDWLPDTGMEGQVVHCWIPNHRDPSKRSNVDKTILLVKIDDRYVPIAEAGVQDLGAEV